MNTPDPIFLCTDDNKTVHGEVLEVGQWYHWDETGAYWYGPFETREVAQQHLQMYIEHLEEER